MGARRLFAGLLCAFGCAEQAAAETTILRPGPCATPQPSYLLAANSGALIRFEPDAPAALGNHVIVFRPKPTTGWASQRLLMRFDLKLDEKGVRIFNSGAVCMEAN